MLGVALVVTVGVVISIGVRYLERRRLWRERAEHLQRRLVVALKRDTTLAGLVFVPEVAVDADGVTNVALSGVCRPRPIAIAWCGPSGVRWRDSFPGPPSTTRCRRNGRDSARRASVREATAA